MKRLLFLIPALPDFVPYVYNYFKIAEDCSIEYDVVCWNRKGDQIELPDNFFIYQRPTKDSYSSLKKLGEIAGFYRFAKRVLGKRNYQLVFTFTIAESVFFEPLLNKNYKGRYVFDIRDYSPMVKISFLKRRIKRLLSNSALNVISSEGYKKWLPEECEYVVCHNTDVDKVYLDDFVLDNKHNIDCLNILTIGAIRNAETNIKVIDALGNLEGIHLDFVGDGNGAPMLVEYCKDHSIKNVLFHGRYQKKDEDSFVQKCDLMNIVLPHFKVSEMSNRFYLSVRFRKPMIVNDGCFQADQVRKYGIGLVIKDLSNMYEEILLYWKSLGWESYDEACKRFLKDVSSDMLLFKTKVARLMKFGN